MAVYLGVSARLLVNLEALNMAESVGNVVRHRRAPVVLRGKDGGFVLRYVPVISGESLAHHYQRLLADIARGRGLPVCRACSQYVFLKHANSQVFSKYDGVSNPKQRFRRPADVEEYVVRNCVVEDVGGFLFADMTVKRTSRFRIGYMIPALDALSGGAAATEAQFHVRYAPGAERGEQAIYYVEVGSAVYVFSYVLDASAVGAYSMENEGAGSGLIVDAGERLKRVEAAVDALAALLGGMMWGAKTSRFMPHWKVLSLVAVVAKPTPFAPTPGHDTSYLGETVARACSLSGLLKGFTAKVYYYEGSESLKGSEGCEGVVVEKVGAEGGYLEALRRAKEALLEELRAEQP